MPAVKQQGPDGDKQLLCSLLDCYCIALQQMYMQANISIVTDLPSAHATARLQ
jgi:hypothetical protein